MRVLRTKSAVSTVSLQSFLDKMPWYLCIDSERQRWISARMTEKRVAPGEHLARHGELPAHAYTVLEGLLKWSISSRDGREVTFSSLGVDSWFGHGTMLGGFPRHGDISALRDSRVTCMPQDVFDWLMAENIVFNNVLLRNINDRLQWFLGSFSARATMSVDEQVARALAGVFHPSLNPGASRNLKITQEEIANLSGFSRQRCNRALVKLRTAGVIVTEYGGITVVDFARLRTMGMNGFPGLA